MFHISKDNRINLTRGDIANIEVTANLQDGETYTFKVGDVVSFKVFKKNDCSSIVIEKRVTIEEETQLVTIKLESEDTRFSKVISKPVDYWYEVELNPDTQPQTFIGYDEYGEKIFRLYPEGGDKI